MDMKTAVPPVNQICHKGFEHTHTLTAFWFMSRLYGLQFLQQHIWHHILQRIAQ